MQTRRVDHLLRQLAFYIWNCIYTNTSFYQLLMFVYHFESQNKSFLHYAPVPLCRIYSRTRTNGPFEFIWGVIPGHSSPLLSIRINSVHFIRVGLAGEYESFEYVQKLCVASTNKFHSCLTHWQRVAIMFVAQLTCCIPVILNVFLLYSGCSYCILGHSYM